MLCGIQQILHVVLHRRASRGSVAYPVAAKGRSLYTSPAPLHCTLPSPIWQQRWGYRSWRKKLRKKRCTVQYSTRNVMHHRIDYMEVGFTCPNVCQAWNENVNFLLYLLFFLCLKIYIWQPKSNKQNFLSALEMFRLKMILRLLQMSSFNGKMSALNEINQLISTFSQQPKPEWLTPAVITVRYFFITLLHIQKGQSHI